jgi:iron complex transport system permease protein
MILFIILFFIQLQDHHSLDILSLDEATAITTGVNTKVVRMKAFIIATLLISLCVSLTGIIGFIGLIVPHIARDLFGSSMYNNLFYSTIFGGILLTISDTISRIIVPSGGELPVGIITSLLGGIFFFYLLIRKRGAAWF